MSDRVKQAVEALRIKKRTEEESAKNKKDAELVKWEAEILLELEDYTDQRIITELTDDIDIYDYLANLIYKINCYTLMKSMLQNTQHSLVYLIKSLSTRDAHNEAVFKVKYLVNHINYIKVYPEYIIKEIRRTQIIAEEKRIAKEKKDEEERIAKANANEEERGRRQQILDETNNNIRKILVDSTAHTFTDITLSDWDKIYEKQFISYNNNVGWIHSSVDIHNKYYSHCYTGMPQSFINYYEEGKVPFFTKCPTCNSPTKFNYLNMIHQTGDGGCHNQRSCNFKEVYCENHYLYDSSTNKHYRANSLGDPVHLNHPMQGAWHIQAWSPQGNWAAWDPSDPDGAKASAEKKRNEVEEIQKQIAHRQIEITELQAKLTALQ